MGKRNPGFDAYIARSAPFARPILKHLRRVVHAGCPDVEETFKWGQPAFVHHGIVCWMSAFKAHATFGFWKHALLFGARGPGKSGEKAMGQFGRLTSIADLPGERRLRSLVKRAAALNVQGVGRPRPTRTARARRPTVPRDLAAALRKHRKASATFKGFSPGRQREYVEWLTGAKRAETRARRLETAIAWLAEGKPHNWRYLRR